MKMLFKEYIKFKSLKVWSDIILKRMVLKVLFQVILHLLDKNKLPAATHKRWNFEDDPKIVE